MKDNNQEIFPLVDEAGNVTGSATRGVCHNGSHLLHPGPQISSFFVDNAKVRKFQGSSKFNRQKSTQKSTHEKTCKMFADVESFNYFCSVKY